MGRGDNLSYLGVRTRVTQGSNLTYFHNRIYILHFIDEQRMCFGKLCALTFLLVSLETGNCLSLLNGMQN